MYIYVCIYEATQAKRADSEPRLNMLTVSRNVTQFTKRVSYSEYGT